MHSSARGETSFRRLNNMPDPVKFGYWPDTGNLNFCGINITALSNISSIKENLEKSDGVERGWAYCRFPSRIFGLPKTHQMEINSNHAIECDRFLIWCLGFFVGMRLTQTDMGYLDAAPIEQGKLCDFLCTNRELPHALEPALDFFDTHGHGNITETLLAAIHTLWLSYLPQLLRFEQYHYAYIAVDALWSVASRVITPQPVAAGHSARLQTLANTLGITLPQWPTLIKERNNAIHQGLFYGQPLGFAVDPTPPQGGNVIVEMQAFICRAIIKLLNVPAQNYITSACTTRMRHSLF